jgi:prolipoprotein diacylglyceryltransferase/protein-S-isoprenylcysteine O-methyltransferase Ste14
VSAARRSPLGPALYGALFVVVLPALLFAWERALAAQLRWAIPALPWPGGALAAIGLALMLAGMRALVVHGDGLPMNAYPTRRFVSRGPYALVSHPIYVGAFLFALGLSAAAGSAVGVAIVSPVLGLMMLSLLWGYERPALLARFGDAPRTHLPLVAWPPADERPASPPRRVLAAALVAATWFGAGCLVDRIHAGAPGGAFAGTMHLDVPHALATLAPLAFVLTGVLFARTLHRLRTALTTALTWALLSLLAYVTIPALGSGDGRAWLLADALAATFAAAHVPVWNALRRATEWVANSRRDVLLLGGRLRVISHAAFSFTMGVVGAWLMCAALREPAAVVLTIACATAGAALYAQASWGSASLLRPFGFWGAVPGMLVALLVSRAAWGVAPLDVVLAATLCAPWAQAVGRLRCLAQGCCHGVPTDERLGIRVWQPQSRVVVLSKLEGRWILPTQLFSILFNLVLGALLVSAWLTRALPVTTIAGLYFLLTGIERFAEDAYRGETQTRVIRGLKEPQWIDLGSCVGGLLLATVPSAFPTPGTLAPAAADVTAMLASGAIAAFAMSIDFPRARWRFSRLSG